MACHLYPAAGRAPHAAVPVVRTHGRRVRRDAPGTCHADDRPPATRPSGRPRGGHAPRQRRADRRRRAAAARGPRGPLPDPRRHRSTCSRGAHAASSGPSTGSTSRSGKGEILASWGSPASGKTTTGRVVVKLTRQTGGHGHVRRRGRLDAVGHRAARAPTGGASSSSSRTRTRRSTRSTRSATSWPSRSRSTGSASRARSASSGCSPRSRPPACAPPRTSRTATRTSCPAASASAW